MIQLRMCWRTMLTSQLRMCWRSMLTIHPRSCWRTEDESTKIVLDASVRGRSWKRLYPLVLCSPNNERYAKARRETNTVPGGRMCCVPYTPNPEVSLDASNASPKAPREKDQMYLPVGTRGLRDQPARATMLARVIPQLVI